LASRVNVLLIVLVVLEFELDESCRPRLFKSIGGSLTLSLFLDVNSFGAIGSWELIPLDGDSVRDGASTLE
jgi:hypothetical protein